MKLLVIGASRGIGRQVVIQALESGHTVTAFSRHPESLGINHVRLQLQAGDVLDISSVEKVVAGHDVVACTLGLPTLKAIGPPVAKRSYVLSEGTDNIVKAMQAKKVNRLLCVTAIGTGDSAQDCTFLARIVLRCGLRWLFREKDKQEASVKKSGLNWTIICPTALTNGKKTEKVISRGVHSGILTHISRADVAAWIISNINQAASYKQIVAISYPARVGDSFRWIKGYLSS